MPPQRPFVPLALLHDNILPILPKHRQLAKRTLSIHIPDSTVSWVASPPKSNCSVTAPAALPYANEPAVVLLVKEK